MKKKYLLNGKIYTEEDLTPFAKENQLDLNVYVQEVGATEFNDANTYEFQGKEYTGNDLADFARENEMPFQDYLKEIGAKKKADTLSSKQDLGSGGAASASAAQSTESEGGLFAPVRFAEKNQQILNTKSPDNATYSYIEENGNEVDADRFSMLKNINDVDFLKKVKEGKVNINIQNDDALGNLLNDALQSSQPKEVPKQEESSAWKDFGKSVYNNIIDASVGVSKIAAQYMPSPASVLFGQEGKEALKNIAEEKGETVKAETSKEFNDAKPSGIFRGDKFAIAKVASEIVPSAVGTVASFTPLAPVAAPSMASYFFARSYDATQDKLKDKNIPQASKELYSISIGGIEAAWEASNLGKFIKVPSAVKKRLITSASGELGKRLISTGAGLTESVIKKETQSAVKKMVKVGVAIGKSLVKPTVAETGEEVGTAASEFALDKAFDAFYETDLASENPLEDIFESGVGGFGGGLMLSLPLSILGINGRKYRTITERLSADNSAPNIISVTEEFNAQLQADLAQGNISQEEANEASAGFSDLVDLAKAVPNFIKDPTERKIAMGVVSDSRIINNRIEELKQEMANADALFQPIYQEEIVRLEKEVKNLGESLFGKYRLEDTMDERKSLEEIGNESLFNKQQPKEFTADEEFNAEIAEATKVLQGAISQKKAEQEQPISETETKIEDVKIPINERNGESVTVNIGGKAISGIVEVDEGGKAQIVSGNQIFEMPADIEYVEYVSPVRIADDGSGIEYNGDVYSEVRFDVNQDGQERVALIKDDGTLMTVTNPVVVEELKYQSALAIAQQLSEQEANNLINEYESERAITETTQEGVSEVNREQVEQTEQEVRLQEAIAEIELLEQIALEQIEQAGEGTKLVQFTPKGSKEAKVYSVTKNADGTYSATLNGKKVVNKDVLKALEERHKNTTKKQTDALIPKLQEQLNQLKQEVENKLFGVTPKTETDAVQVEKPSQVPIQPETRISEEVEEGTPEAEPKEVAKEEVKPKPTKKEKVIDLDKKKKKGEDFLKNMFKYGGFMPTDPKQWVLAFFASGKRMNTDAAKDLTGYNVSDMLWAISGKSDATVDAMFREMEGDLPQFENYDIGKFKTDIKNIIQAGSQKMQADAKVLFEAEKAKLEGDDLDFFDKKQQDFYNRQQEGAEIAGEVFEQEADGDIGVNERVEQAQEIVEGMSEDEQSQLLSYLEKFRNEKGDLDWNAVANNIDDFLSEFYNLTEKTQNVIIKIIQDEKQQKGINEVADIDAEKDATVKRADIEKRLNQARQERLKAESDYQKAKDSFDKDAKEKQADMFRPGNQQGIVDDLAEKQKEVDRRKSILDEAIKKEENLQSLLDDKEVGQQELDVRDKRQELLDKVKQAEEELKKQNKKRDDFYNNDFVIFDPKSRAQTDIDLLAALGKYVKAKLQLASYDFKTFLSDIKAKGIELSKDGEAFLKDWFADIEKTAVKGLINKQTGVTRPTATEQKRIDKAYALGVADTKADFKAKLDELKSDFKEFLSYTEGEAKKAIQAAKDKGAMLLDQERYMKKQITSLVSSALNKDFISQRTFNTIMNRLGKAKTPKQYQKLFDYINKAAEQGDYAERMAEVSKLQEQARKRNHTSLTKAVKDFTSINPELIPDNLLPKYITALDELSGRVPSYQTMQDIYLQVMASKQPPKAFDEISTLAKAQELYNQIGINNVTNVEEYVNLFKDINAFKRKILQLIENETDPTIIQGYEQMLENVGKDQEAVEAKYATQIETIKKNMIAELRQSINTLSTEGQTAPEKALLNDFFDLTDADLENLTPEELYNLQSILDNVKEYGYVDVFRLNPLVVKARTYGKPTAELTNQIKKAKSFNDAFKDKFEAVRKLGGTFSSFWETSLGLQNLGMGAFTKYIAAPMEKAVATYRREVENAYSEYIKIKNKYGIKNDVPFGIKKNLMDKAGKETNQMTKLGMISTYLREYAMSFDEKYAGKKDTDQQSFGTRDWFAQILEDAEIRSNYTKDEIDRIREVHNKLPKINGKVDVKAVWDSYINGTTEFLTKNELDYLKEVNQWKEKNLTDKQKYANELRGKPFDELLFHVKRIRKEGGKKQSDPVELSGKNNNVRIAAGSGKEVTNNNVGAIEVDFEKIFTESVEETNRDFYMTPFLQEQAALLNNVRKDLPSDKKEYIIATKENLQAALNNEFGSPTVSGTERIIRNLTLAKAAQVLIAPIRTGYEMISSYISYPFRAGALNSFSETFRNKDAVKKLLEFTNSPLLNKADVNKHFDVVKGSLQGKGMLEKGIDFFAAMPERNMVNLVWMASFDNEFKKITGKDFDRTKINDTAYMRENKKAIEEAGAISDMVYQQISGATTSAGTRRFALPQGKVIKALGLQDITAKSTGGQIITFFTNYPFRETEQWLKSARGIKDVIKDRNVTSENAKYVLYPVVGTFLGASLYQFMQALGFQTKNYLTAILGEDDEEEEKALLEINRIASPEGIFNEMIAGTASTAGTRYGSITKAALQIAGTMVYNLSENETLKAKGKAITRELTFKNPLEIKRAKDGSINTYGIKGEIASQVTSYIPFVQVVVDNFVKAIDAVGGLGYLYEKIGRGERLTDDEKDVVIALQSVINLTNLFINFSGKAIPFTSEIERFGRQAKKELKDEKKKEGKGEIIETDVIQKDVIQKEVTPTEIQ